MLKLIGNRFLIAFYTFKSKRGTTLAAASSFYLLLTIVPLMLLLVRVVGFLIGDITESEIKIFEAANHLFPDVAPEVLLKVKNLIKGPLYGGAQFTILNFSILLISALSFFNSIMNGLYLMTEDRSHASSWKYVKGLVIIFCTIVLVTILLGIQPALHYAIEFVKNNFLITFLYEHFEGLRASIDYLKSYQMDGNILFRSNFFYFAIFLTYFTFLYRWFFSWKIAKREALLGAFTFVFFLLLGKNLFWIYFLYGRAALINSYGDYYTLILGIIWIFMVMCFFFYGACLCHVLQKDPIIYKIGANDEGNLEKID